MRLKTRIVCAGLALLACSFLTGAAVARTAWPAAAAAGRVETPAQLVARGGIRPAPAGPLAALSDPNDQCPGAIEIPCGNIDLHGDTFTATNDYTFIDTTLSCTTRSANGRDVVYKLNAQAGDQVFLTYSCPTSDAAMYIVTDCSNVQGTCVAGIDDFTAGFDEQLNYTFTSAATYYLILDNWGPDTYGAWSLAGRFWSCGLQTPPGDICATATAIPCGQFAWSGTTQMATNDYSFPSLGASCANSLAGGLDVTYRLNMTAGDSLAVTYTSSADGVVYLLSDCSTTTSCLAGANVTGVGGAETLNFRFTFTGVYYLVLDSNGASSFGTWNMVTTLICVNAPPINDACAGAFPLSCGAISLSGTTAYANNDYTLTESGCTGTASPGPDVVYRIEANVGDSLSLQYGYPFNIQPNPLVAPDAVVYLVKDCANLPASCFAGVDNAVSGGIEQLHYRFWIPGTYYLILDSYEPTPTGKWQAVGNLICAAPTAVGGRPDATEFRLGAPSPNPFASWSTVRFALAARGHATLRIYDLAGRAVRTLVDGDVGAGEHVATWNARDDSGAPVNAGVYYARLISADRAAYRKLIFVR